MTGIFRVSLRTCLTHLSSHATQLPHRVGKTLDALVDNSRQHCCQRWQLNFTEPIRCSRLTAYTCIAPHQHYLSLCPNTCSNVTATKRFSFQLNAFLCLFLT